MVVGIKKQMRQWWSADGKRWPVTVVAVTPAVVVGNRDQEIDGYKAIQLGYGMNKTINKPQEKQMQKAGLKGQPQFLQEVKIDGESDLKVGDTVNVGEVLQQGDMVSVRGVSKGRGFSGVMKRWGFSGGPRTHGQSDRARAPGSIGQGTDPGRVHKGKKMPGRYGGDTKSIKNLVVIKVDDQNGEVWLSGLIPGSRSAKVTITKLNKKSGIKFEEVRVESEAGE